MSPVRLSLSCRSRIARSPLSDVKKLVLLDRVQTYVNPSRQEEAEMESILEKDPEFKDVRWEDLTWLGQREARAAAAGKAEGEAEAILTVLEARDLPVSDAARQQILRCTDLATLKTWLQRAAVAERTEQVLQPVP